MFKERFFVFMAGPEPAPTPESNKREIDELRKRLDQLYKEFREKRGDLSDEHSAEATNEAPLNRSDLISRILDRIQPDNIEKFTRMIPAIAEDLEPKHIETILNLTERCSEKDLVFDKFTTFIDLGIIHISKLSPDSIAILIRNQKGKPEQIKILFDSFLANWATAEYTIAACENDPELLKTLYEALSNSRVLKQIQPKQLGILIDGFQKEGNEAKIKEIFGKFFDNYFDAEKLIMACATSGEKDKNLQLLANEITKHKTLFASLRGDALAAFSVNVDAFAHIKRKSTWEQHASMLAGKLPAGEKLTLFKGVLDNNQHRVSNEPKLAAPLVEFAHSIKGSEKEWYAKLVDRLERNPATINALMTGSTVSAAALGSLFNSLSAEIRGKVKPAPDADISLFKILHDPELVERKIRETCIPEGFITERDPEGNILIKMTAAVRKLPEGLSISDFPSCKLTLDKTGEKITFSRNKYAEFAEKEQVFNEENNTMAATIQGDLDAITSAMVEYHELFHLPTEDEVTETRVAKDEAMYGFEFNEANWKKISTHNQIEQVLRTPPFAEKSHEVDIQTTKDIVEEDGDAKIDIDEVFEYSRVFGEVEKVREYTEEFDYPDPNSTEDFLHYFNWLKNALAEEIKSPEPRPEKIKDYREVLATMHAVYKQSDRFMQMIVHADVLSDADVQVIEGIRAAEKGAPVPPEAEEPPAPGPETETEPAPEPETEERDEGEPAPEAPAEREPEAPTPSREPVTKLDESITSLEGEALAKAMLEKAGYKFGDNISWTEAGSERSFVKTEKYLAELTRRNADGRLVHDTIESIHLLNAGWLMRIIIQDGSIDTNAHNVANHIESNISLINSITTYEAITPNEFAEGTSFEKMIEGTPGIVIYREKEIRFYFPIKDAKGKHLSRRSFNITDEFKEALKAANPDNSLKVRQFCYKWLLKIIEKDGSKDPAKSKVIEAAESNKHLESEIARIEGIKDLPAAGAVTPARREEAAAEGTEADTAPAEGDEEGAAEGEGEEAAEGTEEAEATPDPLQEIITKYLPGFRKEVSSRTIAPGDYQLKNNPTNKIYTESGVLAPISTFRFMKITDPTIYKLTKGTETLYLVKADFHKLNDTTNTVDSTSFQNGFVNIDDLATGHGGDRTQLAEIASDFNNPELTASPDIELDTTLIYSVHNEIQLHTGDDHRFKTFQKTKKVTVLAKESKEMEGQKYVKVKIEGTNKEGWMLKSNLDIPGEYTTFFDITDNGGATSAEKLNVFMKGTYTMTAKMQGKDLLEALFTSDSTLRGEFENSRLSKTEYLQVLKKFQEGKIINIVRPEKSLRQRLAEYRQSATDRAFEVAQRRIKDQAFNERNTKAFDSNYELEEGNPLIELIGDEARWNALWAKEGEFQHNYIDGIDAVINAFEQLGLKDIEARDALRTLMDIGYNERVKFEEVFDKFIGGTEKYSGNFDDFKEELDKLETQTASWRPPHDDTAIKVRRIENHMERTRDINYLMKNNPDTYESDDEYKLWLREEEAIRPLMKVYFGDPHSDDPEKRIGMKAKLERLEHLRTTIFEPIDKLVHAIIFLSLKTSVEQSFLDQHRDTFATLPTLAATTSGPTQVFFNLEDLLKGDTTLPAFTSFPNNIAAITLSSTAKDQFAAQFPEYREAAWNDPVAILKLITKLYSIDTLVKENCLKKLPRSVNKIVLVKLPENFKKTDPRIRELAALIHGGNDVFANQDLISEVSKRLDDNKMALSRIDEIFKKDRGPTTHYNWTENVADIFWGPDTTERTLTMYDVGAKKVTKPSEDFLKRYISDSAARQHLLGRITQFEKGTETQNHETLKKELKKRLKLGLSSLFMSDKFEGLRNRVLMAEYGTYNASTGKMEFPTDEARNNAIRMAYEELSPKIDDFRTPLSPDVKELIRLGDFVDNVIESNPEVAEITLSQTPEIRAIQQELLNQGFPVEDLPKVEEIFLGGVGISVTDPAGVGVHVPIATFGDGWSLGGQLAAGAPGIGGGLDLSYTFKFNGGQKLTMGVHGGFLYIGGRADLKFPLTDDDSVEGGVFGVGGYSALGFYAGGGIVVRRNLNKEHEAAFKEEMKLQGFTETNDLIKRGASAAEVRESILKIPGYGPKFATLKNEYNVSDRALRELFTHLKNDVETKVTTAEGLMPVPFNILGVGGFAGVVGVVPIVGALIEIQVGEEFVDIRSVIPGYENMSKASDAEINALVQKELGRKANLLHETTGDTGHVIYDPSTQKFAILESSESMDLSEFDTLHQSNEALARIDAELIQRPGNLLKLKVNNPREAQADIKVIIDTLQVDPLHIDRPQIGVSGVVRDGELHLITTDLKGLIITREDFTYPYEKDGNTKLTVITIKTNPERTRPMIEAESTQIAYQAAGHQMEIRRGIPRVGSSTIISDREYTEHVFTAPEAIKTFDEAKFQEWRTKMRTALNVRNKDIEMGRTVRSDVITKVVDQFQKNQKMEKLYRELSTQGTSTYNPEQLITEIKKFATTTAGVSDLSIRELDIIMIELASRSFVDAAKLSEDGVRPVEATAEKNLEFAKTVFTRLFNKDDVKDAVGSGFAPADLVNEITKNLANPDFTETHQTIEAGTIFASVVGTFAISGLREVPFYGSELDKESGVIKLSKYHPGAEGIEGAVGRAVLQILSPLDTSSEKALMNSQLAMKMAAANNMYMLLGHDGAMQLAECFETDRVTRENRATFEKFKQMVVAVREAQNAGRNTVEIGDYQIKVSTDIGIGIYKKCTNPSLLAKENVAILEKGEQVALTTARKYSRARVQNVTQKRAITATLAIMGSVFDEKGDKHGAEGGGEKPAEHEAAKNNTETVTTTESTGTATVGEKPQSTGGDSY